MLVINQEVAQGLCRSCKDTHKECAQGNSKRMLRPPLFDEVGTRLSILRDGLMDD